MLTELGKWFLNLALAIIVTMILKPLLNQQTNPLAILVGIAISLMLVILGCILIKKGEKNGGL